MSPPEVVNLANGACATQSLFLFISSPISLPTPSSRSRPILCLSRACARPSRRRCPLDKITGAGRRLLWIQHCRCVRWRSSLPCHQRSRIDKADLDHLTYRQGMRYCARVLIPSPLKRGWMTMKSGPGYQCACGVPSSSPSPLPPPSSSFPFIPPLLSALASSTLLYSSS